MVAVREKEEEKGRMGLKNAMERRWNRAQRVQIEWEVGKIRKGGDMQRQTRVLSMHAPTGICLSPIR